MNIDKRRALFTLAGVMAASGFLTMPAVFAQRAKVQKAKQPATPNPTPTAGNTTWPLAPQSTPNLLESRRSSYYLPSLKFRELLPGPPPGDYNLLQEVTSSSTIRGTLLYPTDYGRRFFVLRGININGLINGQSTNTATYPLYAPGKIFEPEFSPDGKRILFKAGDPFESTSEHFLFLWDTEAAQVRAVSREPTKRSEPSGADALGEGMVFRNVYWSPDSKWIAYVRGGDRGGRVWPNMMYPQLRLLNVDTGRSRRVTRNFGVVRDMAWTSQNTLLFVMLPKDRMPLQEEEEQDKATDPEPDEPAQASIFEATPGRGTKPSLVIADAERPVPSPDNRWIAFARWSSKGTGDPAQQLCVFDRQSGAIKMLAEQKLGFVLWTPDSRQLVVVKTLYFGSARGEAQVSVIDIQTGARRDVATLEAHDYKPLSGSEDKAQFKALKLSRDGRFLFVYVAEIGLLGPPVGEKDPRNQISLQAVDLSDGSITTVARFDSPGPSIMGLDWHDESGVESGLAISSRRSRRR